YNTTKKELRNLFYILKRLKKHLFNIRFIIKINAIIFIYQFNNTASNVPGTLLIK
ncbi:hypothetical protein QBC45DRAFT_328124, partial [Copromyces sp. CBS 386.78]